MRSYDFTSLHQPITAADIRAVVPSAGAKWERYVVRGIYGFVVASFLAAIGVSLSLTSGRLGALTTTILFFAVLGFVILIATSAVRRRNKYLAIVSRFARANHAAFRFDSVPVGLSGMIFDEGHSRKIIDMISFEDGLELGNYQYVTGSGKSQQLHTYGYIRVALNKNLPNMVLDGKGNNFLGITNLPDVYHSSQRLQLEGDFNKYFDLYAPKQYERDALYVFTPDVMHVLINNGTRYDMEIIDNELFFYHSKRLNLSSESVLRQTLESVNAIASELRNQTRRYSDERHSMVSNIQSVAEQGRRLKKSVRWVYVGLIIGAIVLYYTSVAVLPPEANATIQFALGVLLCIFGVMQIVIKLRQ